MIGPLLRFWHALRHFNLLKWYLTITREYYILTVWFHKEQLIQESNIKVVTKSEKVFHVKKFNKISDTHITGLDLDNKPFEIRTKEPFDYYIRKIY